MAGASAVRAAAQARRAASAAPSAERPVSLSTGGASLAAKARTKSRPWRPFGPSGVVGTAREAPNPPGVTPRVRGGGADRRSGRAVRAQGATPVTVVGGGALLVGTQSRAARAPCTAAATFCAFNPGAAAEQAAPLSCSGSETSAAAAAKAPLSSDSRRSSTSTYAQTLPAVPALPRLALVRPHMCGRRRSLARGRGATRSSDSPSDSSAVCRCGEVRVGEP